MNARRFVVATQRAEFAYMKDYALTVLGVTLADFNEIVRSALRHIHPITDWLELEPYVGAAQTNLTFRAHVGRRLLALRSELAQQLADLNLPSNAHYLGVLTSNTFLLAEL